MRQILLATAGVARDSHFEYDRRTLLVEKQSTNLVINSDDCVAGTGWVSGTAPVMIANSYRCGTVPMHRMLVATTPGADRAQIITLTGNGNKAVQQLLRFAGEVGTTVVRFFDNTAAVNRFSASIVWAADGTATCTATVGTLLRFTFLGNGVYLLEGMAVGCVAANVNLVFPLQAASTAGADIGGIQIEDSPYPTSYTGTGGTIVTRSADRCELQWTAGAPSAMTLYTRFVERGSVFGSGQVFLLLGAASLDNCLYVQNNGNVYQLVLIVGGVARTSTAAVLNFGDLIELRCILNANGSVQIGQSINGAAETLGIASAALALPGAWSAATLALCGITGSPANVSAAFERIVAQAGVQTLATMRALAL